MLLWKHAIKLLYRGIALANSMAVHIYMYSMFETIVTHKYTFKTFIASSVSTQDDLLWLPLTMDYEFSIISTCNSKSKMVNNDTFSLID